MTTQQPVLPVPKQELALVKRGLDAYFATLRKKGITVEAPFMDNDYCWWGHWNDDAVETAIGGVSGPMGVATCTMTLNTGVKGRRHACQSAYYLFSMVRHVVLHDGDGPGGREWYKSFNRINARGPVSGPAASWKGAASASAPFVECLLRWG